MGVYSTMSITRADADRLLMGMRFDKLPDKVIEDVLFQIFGETTLHNFSIVEKYPAEDRWSAYRHVYHPGYLERRLPERADAEGSQWPTSPDW